ncbi:TlpA disulfide reductase family protein [Marinospirillum perlucidum]|uniref:TlpA disulfide reductase family protein n=1 Tax=Marinospirillum perlucidum TaxID=1982602 RepID=UPI000DF43E50|nr:TlpA disulfide reductase family protein [Marinospirillum perlucidum]
MMSQPTHRLSRWFAAVALMLGVTAVDFASRAEAAELIPAQESETAPLRDLKLPLMQEEGQLSMQDLEGEVVLVDFWASWCGPCRESFPWMNRMQAQYADQGLRIVGVNLDQNLDEARRFLDQLPAAFTVLHDDQARLPEAYGLIGMPSSYLLDRQGRLRASHTGFHASRVETYEASIQQLLAE